MDTFPVVKCYFRYAYFVGWVEAILATIKFCFVLVGNIKWVVDSAIENKKASTVQAVVTRSNSKSSPIHPFILYKLDRIDVDHVQ